MLNVPQAASGVLDEVFGGAEGDVGEPAASQEGPDPFDRGDIVRVGDR